MPTPSERSRMLADAKAQIDALPDSDPRKLELQLRWLKHKGKRRRPLTRKKTAAEETNDASWWSPLSDERRRVWRDLWAREAAPGHETGLLHCGGALAPDERARGKAIEAEKLKPAGYGVDFCDGFVKFPTLAEAKRAVSAHKERCESCSRDPYYMEFTDEIFPAL